MRHILLTAAFLLCFLFCDAQKFVEAYNGGNYKKSLSLAQKTIEKDAKNLDAYLIKALSNMHLALDPETKEEFPIGVESSITTLDFIILKDKKETFIPAHQEQVDTLLFHAFQLAENYYNNEKVAKSEKLLDKLLNIQPKPEYYFLKGKICMDREEFELGAQYYNYAAAKIYTDFKEGKIPEPYLSEAFIELAYSIYEDRDYSNAYTIFNRALMLFKDRSVETEYLQFLQTQSASMFGYTEPKIYDVYLKNLDSIEKQFQNPLPFQKLKWEVIFNYYNSLRLQNENIMADSMISLYACRENNAVVLDTLLSAILTKTKINNTVSANTVSCDLNGSNTYKKIYSCLNNGKPGEEGMFLLVDSLVSQNKFSEGIKVLYNIKRLTSDKSKINSYEAKIFTLLKNADSAYKANVNMYELTVLFPENKNFKLLQQNEAVNQIISFIDKGKFSEAGVLLRQQIKMLPNDATIHALYKKWVLYDYQTNFKSYDAWTDRIVWNGSTETCDPGKLTAADQEKFLRALNYVRRVAGVPDKCILREEWNAKCQAAALMMSANGDLSHNPPKEWNCFTADGYMGANNSNLSLGYDGIDALMGQVDDDGGNNEAVGHRRWILNPYRKVFGHGSTGSAMALWALGGKDSNYDDKITDPYDTQYVVWPPEYYSPVNLYTYRWSFSISNANFDSCTVEIFKNNKKIDVTILEDHQGYGQNTIVFVPDGLDYSMEPDTKFTIKIKNVRTYTYDSVKDEYVNVYTDYTYWTTYISVLQ